MKTPTEYSTLTLHCRQQIEICNRKAASVSEPEAARLRERAYGIFLGWVALAEDAKPPEIFATGLMALATMTGAQNIKQLSSKHSAREGKGSTRSKGAYE